MINHDEGVFTEPLHGDENDVVTCFMDKTDWDYELGGAISGNTLYPSPEAIPPHKGCGIVEVEVRLKRVVQKEDFKSAARGAMTSQEARQYEANRNADPEWQEYQRLRLRFDKRWKHFLKITGRLKDDEA